MSENEQTALTPEQASYIESQFGAWDRAARAKVWSGNRGIDPEDLCQEMAVREATRLIEKNVAGEPFQSDPSQAVRNPFRDAMRDLQRFRQHPEPEETRAEILCRLEIEVPDKVAEQMVEIMRKGSTEEIATVVRKWDGDNAEYYEERYPVPGLAQEVERQKDADKSEKARLRQVRKRFLSRLFLLLLITGAAILGAELTKSIPTAGSPARSSRSNAVAEGQASQSVAHVDMSPEQKLASRTCRKPVTRQLLSFTRLPQTYSRTCNKENA